jgi:hypothetical protein
VRGPAAGDDRLDPLLPHLTAVTVVIVGAVGVQRPGPSAGLADLAADRWDGLDQWSELRMSLRLPLVRLTASGMPFPSVIRVVLGAGLASVDRARAGFGPPLSART